MATRRSIYIDSCSWRVKLMDYDRFNNSLTKLRDKKEKTLNDEKNLFKVCIFWASAYVRVAVKRGGVCGPWTTMRLLGYIELFVLLARSPLWPQPDLVAVIVYRCCSSDGPLCAA